MSERKVDTEIVRKQYTNGASLIDEAEFIDVSVLDFDDSDGWLYIPTDYPSESSIHNLYTWLKSEPELTLSATRKSIDTRTFTRSKKRSSRCSFESLLDSLSSPVSNTWKTSNFLNIEEDLGKYSEISTANKEEVVPPMLKMAPNISLLAEEAATMSGQESMEVFLNMSHSKGIDSFINLMEPGLSDPLMNVSQPSIFSLSITSLPRDDYLHNTECDKDEETANFTQVCNQEADKYEDAKNSYINGTFSRSNEADNNKSYCLSLASKTYTNDFGSEDKELNETYNADTTSSTVVLLNSNKDKFSTTNLSSVHVNKHDDNTRILQSGNEGKKDLCNLNTTYPSASAQKAYSSFVLDTTYSATDTEVANNGVITTAKSEMLRNKDLTYEFQKSIVKSIPKNIVRSSTPVANSSLSLINDDALNATFKLPISFYNQSTPKNMDGLNNTYRTNKHLESSPVYSTALNSTFKQPTLLRRELLAEIYKGGDHGLDCTYNHVANEHQNGRSKKENIDEAPLNQTINKNDIPVENKYNTYKKESPVNKIKLRAETANEAGACIQNSPEKKYYTFTKRSNNYGGKTDMENAESLDNVDSTFVKPLPKFLKQKQHIPRMFSKLPQFLQKSNPNLVSNSLKTVNTVKGTNVASFGYMKGSQPNIVRDVEKSLANKLYPLGKIKSGSEQRLLELNTGVGELQMLGAGGSTESIESTQSAHSAPDLDDRLSTCSDSSHNSYTTQPMKIEQLHQIVKMQEESLKQDAAPALNRRPLENTWSDMNKDLPSPILKNGDGCDSDSPLSMNCNVKTSSPLISPTRSSQSINTDGHPGETVLKQQNEVDTMKKVEAFSKPVMKIENKTRLRQPTNWNTGNKPANLMSAIPRPPSRIPAPRFVRPTVKNVQGDIKRGYM